MITFTGHKTIKIEDLKTYINEMLANKSICEAEKVSYCILIERVLLNTSNYKGWNRIPDAKSDYDRRYY